MNDSPSVFNLGKKSAIFKGHIRHRRFEPTEHAFSYPIFMLYLDLDELPSLFEKNGTVLYPV